VDEARESLDRAEELAERVGAHGALSDIERFRGMVSRAEGALGDAEAHLARAVEIARDAELELEEAEALREMGDLQRLRGRGHEARASLERARELFIGIGADRDAERVAEMLWEDEPVAA
jgi:tetratricopeptide (TPR) repeat protein